MMVLGSGRTLLLSEPPLYNPHLWIILTDPDGKPPEVVAVMLRTVTSFTDQTLVLQPGEHPFVKHPTSVHYSTTRRFRVAAILTAIQSGRCHLREDATADLLQRAQAGLIASPFTVNAIREHCRERF
jgi:hypothetical protein